MSIDTTVPTALSSSDSVLELYLSVISHTFSSFASLFASLGLWIVHGLALALCFFGLVLAVFILLLPIKFTAERIFENISASAPSNERPSRECQQQDLEANLGPSEDVRTTSVDQVLDNATEEQARPILNKPSHAMDTAMASRAPNDTTEEQDPLANVSDPSPSNSGDDERATHSNDGEIVDMPSDSVGYDRGSDSELEEHDAHSRWPGTSRPASFWNSVR